MKNSTLRKFLFLILAVFSLSPWVSSPIALALGIAFAFTLKTPFPLPKINPVIHRLLKFSIIGLGFGLQLNEALKAGQNGFLITIMSIGFVLILCGLLGKILKLDKILSYLIGVGTAICGGSAIAAISPIIKANGKQISVALAVIFTLNSVALFIYPLVGHLLGLSQEQFGLWCAIGIHDTSSVVGAANNYGEEALKIATTVKLARALWIIPLSLLTMWLFKGKSNRIKIPWFIGGFVLAILVNTYLPIPDVITNTITLTAKAGLHLTLFLIGSTLSYETLRNVGVKPLIFSVLLWIGISLLGLLMVYEMS
ncbi:putative sulfate exporter family transporter [Capnocytophaga canimorsus]|uniref:YeiH family protein n=1 Tax=Capnocytophaga canimorsus TaxID=28188 RepID=UPI000D6E0A98|nr:putative sulfate exporter family transporter [Capnocytophaga canimorsus]AWL79396.1 putative sulfate exporter family transporter [Capnocytophaga canimorsus]